MIGTGLFLTTLLHATVMANSSTILPNLRRYRIEATVGRFVVPRYVLEEFIEARTNEDVQCGNYVSLSLPTSLPSADYNESVSGELLVGFEKLEEDGLDNLPCNSKDELETSYRSVTFAVPIKSNGQSRVLLLADFTEARNRLTPPLLTSDENHVTVDSIEEDGENVTLSIGNDVMTLEIRNVSCPEETNVGGDFDKDTGVNITGTCYPSTFDWNCGSVLDWDTGYCRVLGDNLCEIQRYGGDVCIYATSSRSVRCPATMAIKSATGAFRDFLLGIFEILPVKSFEAEWVDRDHDVGIMYPCLSK